MRNIFIFLVFIASFANAESMYIDCSSSPKDAILNIPSPADKVARVSCTKYGHIIEPVIDWIWTRPGGYNPAFFPAQMVRGNPTSTGNTVFFSSLSIEELNTEVANEKWNFISSLFDNSKEKIKKGLALHAKNSNGGEHTVYFFDNGWGYGCSPTCSKQTAFMILNREKKNVSW